MRTLKAVTLLAAAGLTIGFAAQAAVAAPPASSKSITLVSCALSGTTTLAEDGSPGNGLNTLEPRDINITGQSTAVCVDARLDKSATGGRTITGFTATTTGAFSDSTCLVATGEINVTITWQLNSGSPLTSVFHNDFLASNFLESLPGTGTVTSGLFGGSLAETNSVFPQVTNVLKCLTEQGLTSTTRLTTLIVAG